MPTSWQMGQHSAHATLVAHSTGDIPLALLDDFREELAPDVELHVEESQAFFRSVEPPSWIALLAEGSWWIKAMGAYAALFVAELVREAGKDTWKNRAEIAKRSASALGKIAVLARRLFALTPRLPTRTTISVGLPFPDEHFATELELTGRDEYEVAAEIALFVRYLPVLEQLLEAESFTRDSIAAGIQLQLQADLSLEVTWIDARALTIRSRTLRLPQSGGPEPTKE